MSDQKPLHQLKSFLSTSTLVEDDWDYFWDGVDFNRSDWDIQRSFLHQKAVKEHQICPIKDCLACKLNPRGFPDSQYYLLYTPSSLVMLLSSVPGASYGDRAREWLYNATGFGPLKNSFTIPNTGASNLFNLKPVSGMDTDGIPIYMKEGITFLQCLKDDLVKIDQKKPVGSTITMMSSDELFNSDNDEIYLGDLSPSPCDESSSSYSRSVSLLSNLMQQSVKMINYVNDKVESFTSNKIKKKANSLCKIRDSLAALACTGLDASIKIAETIPITGRIVKKAKNALLNSKFKGATNQNVENFSYAPGTKNNLSFSFCGRSLNPSYEIGAAKCFNEYINLSILDTASYVGSATGALIATALALNLNLDTLETALTDMSLQTNERLLGSFSIRSKLMKTFLDDYIPENFELLPDQLCILITSFPTMKSHKYTKFFSKGELIRALMASLFIPLLHESPIADSRNLYFSGNFFDCLPILDEFTITVSSSHNSANVSPGEDSFSLEDYIGLNWSRETYRSHSQRGYDDALDYLKNLYHLPITSLFFNKNPIIQ